MRTLINIPRLMTEIVVAITATETVIMMVLPDLPASPSRVVDVFLDASLLALLTGPFILWRFLSAARRASAFLSAARIEAERLADIARRTSNAVLFTDVTGRIEWVNEGFTRITGYTLSEVRGQKPGPLLQGPESDPVAIAQLRHAQRTGTSASVEIVNYDKQRRPYRLAIELIPRHDSKGKLIGFMAIESDITDRVEADHQLRLTNARLQAAQQAAEAANRAKSAFLANMSHEIRTPLTAILGFTDLLRDDKQMASSPEQQQQAIETITAAGRHLLTVINDILDLSKIEADRMTIENIETPLTEVLREVQRLVSPKARGKGVAFVTELLTPVPEQIMSDAVRLRQVLLNLAGNAVKFTEAGTVKVRVHADQSGPASRLIIDVEDTGSGMTSEQASKLFHAFAQADETVTRKFGGTGLGLTISYRLAALMGGAVTLERTELGKGSCFRLTLPLTPAPNAETVTCIDAPTRSSTQRVIAPQLSGSILLAEDGPDNQRLIAFHLRKAGATVQVADNGRIALSMIDQAAAAGKRFDLLLTDMQMPEMDGYTLARTLRQRGDAIPIVALTAHSMAEDRAKCLDAGCDDYTTKPIDKVALISMCARWVACADRAVELKGAA
jgi:PAS domain S-box-containing protein